MPYWSFDIGGEKLVWYTRQWPRIAKYMVQSLLLMVAMEGRTGAVQDRQSPEMAEWFNHFMLVQIRKLLDELSTDEQSFRSCFTTTVECPIPIPFGGLLIIAMRGWQPRNLASISINMYDAEEWQDEHAFMQLHKHQ